MEPIQLRRLPPPFITYEPTSLVSLRRELPGCFSSFAKALCSSRRSFPPIPRDSANRHSEPWATVPLASATVAAMSTTRLVELLSQPIVADCPKRCDEELLEIAMACADQSNPFRRTTKPSTSSTTRIIFTMAASISSTWQDRRIRRRFKERLRLCSGSWHARQSTSPLPLSKTTAAERPRADLAA